MHPIESHIVVGFMIFVVGLLISSIRREAAIVLHARCSRCRYNVEKLTVLTCPECGNDLHGSGTIKPGDEVPMKHLPPNVVHVVFAVILGLLVFAVAATRFPYAASSARVTAAGTSGLFQSCWVYAFGTRMMQASPFHSRSSMREYPRFISRSDASATLAGPLGQVSLEILDDRMLARYDGPSGTVTTSDAFDEGDILRWMEAAGCDVSHPRALEDATAIAAMIRHAVVGGSDDTPGTGPTSVFKGLSQPRITFDRWDIWTPWWMYATAIAAGFAAWYGMRMAHQRRRR
jgi:hypothetical protein